MTTVADLRHLDDAAVLRILSAATEQLRAQLPERATGAIKSAEEARQAVAQLLEEGGANPPVDILPDEGTHAAQARALLELILRDPETSSVVRELVDHPPDDEQRSVELALAGAVILGGLVTWLQTKIEIDVHRKEGKTDFRFHMRKDTGSNSLIETIAKQVVGLL
jgi:hypothetical protein